MQSTLPVILMSDSDPSLSTPQQKLRKISFDASELNQLPFLLKRKQSYIVEGWGNQNWDFKTQSLANSRKQLKPLSRAGNEKSLLPSRPPSLPKDLSKTKTNYIEKLQEKLVKLVSIKQKNQKIKLQSNNEKTLKPQLNSFKVHTPHYQAPRKPFMNGHRTTSTSESENEKFDHNFTNVFDKKQKHRIPSLKIKKSSKDIPAIGKSFNQVNVQELPVYTGRQKTRNSILAYFEPLTERGKEVSMISYPVIDSQKITRRGRNIKTLNDFFKRFNERNSPQKREATSLLTTNPQKGQTRGFSRKKAMRKTQEFLFKARATRQKQLFIQFDE